MRALCHTVLLVASVAVAQCRERWHHIDVQALRDPSLRELYLRDLEVARHERHPQHKRTALVGTVPTQLLPGHHKLVDKALTGMPEEVEELRRKQSAVNEAQGKLRGSVNDVALHSSDAAQIKRAIARRESQLRLQKKRQHLLEEDVNQIENAHSALVKSVHASMDPKLDGARARLKKKQEGLQNEEDATKYWTEQVDKVKTKAKEAIGDEEVAKKRLSELKSQTTWALKQEDIAERKAAYNKQMADEEVASLKYAQGQYDKEVSHLKAAQLAAKEVEQRLQGQDSMRAMEEVEDAQREVRADEDEVENWKTNVDHINAQASDMIKQNNTSHDNLLELQAQVAWAKKEQALSEKELDLKQAMATQEVRTLKYVETKYEGEASKLKVAEVAAKSADDSVHKLDAIRAVEEEKVHQQYATGKDRLHKRMKKWEASRSQTAQEIDSLEKQYANWKEEQQARSQQVDQVQQESAAASQAYSAGQHEAFARAQEKVFQRELASSHAPYFGEWTNEEGF